MAADAPLPRICVLGSLNIDLVSYVPHHPEPGETLTSDSFAVSPGGKGANQAIACAKLSRPRPPPPGATSDASAPTPTPTAAAAATAHIAMVGAVGDDPYGTQLLANLAAHGVETSGVRRCAAATTGVAIILVDAPTGQNRIVLSPGANHAGMGADAFEAAVRPLVLGRGGGGAATPPDLLIMQLEVPQATVVAALAAARAHGVPVLLNPAPAVPGLPAEVWRGLAHLVVNETEASLLSGLPVATLDTAAGCRAAARWFVERGVRAVVITLGGRGVYFLSKAAAAADGADAEDEEEEEEGLVPAEKVAAVVDTTAAGDTFVGQYALEVVVGGRRRRGFDIGAAVRKANRAAARTVERRGAQDSIPWRDELV